MLFFFTYQQIKKFCFNDFNSGQKDELYLSIDCRYIISGLFIFDTFEGQMK